MSQLSCNIFFVVSQQNSLLCLLINSEVTTPRCMAWLEIIAYWLHIGYTIKVVEVFNSSMAYAYRLRLGSIQAAA